MLVSVGLIAAGILVAAMFLCFVRLVRGPTEADRVLALDTLGTISIGFILAVCIAADEAVLLDVATVMALIIFMATVAFAWYLERRPQG
jgi:multicomponent Na+:H+ antiporter subunit F